MLSQQQAPVAIDTTFFAQYDALMNENATLGDVAGRLASCENEQRRAIAARGQEEKELAESTCKMNKHQRKLQSAQKGVVHALLQGGKKKATATETDKIQTYTASCQTHEAEIQRLSAHIDTTGQDVSQLRLKLNRQRQVVAQSRNMFDYAVASVPATQEMRQQFANEQNINQRLAENTKVLSDSQRVVAHYETAFGRFKEALRYERMARNCNYAAEMDGGFGFGVEAMDQYSRDMEMRVAMQAASAACHEMSCAVRSITPLMEARDPALAQRLRAVPLPLLRGQAFGQDMMMDAWFGEFGAMMNDVNCGRKIRENMAMLRICCDIVRDHIQAVFLFQGYLASDNTNQERIRQQVYAALESERMRVFNQLREYAHRRNSYNDSHNSNSNSNASSKLATEYIMNAPPPAYEADASAPPLLATYA